MTTEIRLVEWDDETALRVFRNLDLADLEECEIIRGAPALPLDLFSEWRLALGSAHASKIASVRRNGKAVPFAVMCLCQAGQFGVGWVAVLACNHAHFRRELAQLLAFLRRELPGYARAQGFNRLEARSWRDHPTGNQLLTSMGFTLEAQMSGFGPGGADTLNQFALIPQDPNPEGLTHVPPA